MEQMEISELLQATERRRKPWHPPEGRSILQLADVHTEVRPIYDPTSPLDARREGRRLVLGFLARFHYMHVVPGAKEPAMTWAFGLFLNREMAGVAILNPPAAGVVRWLYGDDVQWYREVIAATRVACTDAAPFNSESHLVSSVWRQLPHLDDRFSVGIAMSDLAVVDPLGRRHTGGIYAASNALWAGVSEGSGWRGFLNPATGARISRKNGGRNRNRAECPSGWIVEPAARLNRFLWFVGRGPEQAMEALDPRVRVAVRSGPFPVWRRPSQVSRRARRAYMTSQH